MFSPHRSTKRLNLTEQLISQGESDLARWSNPRSLASAWSRRARIVSTLIPPHSSVLDVGCGAMALRNYLPSTCSYIPADIVSRCPECIVVDLNKDPYPDVQTDVVTLLGVVEYLHDPLKALLGARTHQKQLVLSYVCHSFGPVAHRRKLGWVNDYGLAELKALLNRSGWSVVVQKSYKRRLRTHEYILLCN